MTKGIFRQERTGKTEIIWNDIEGEYGYWEDGLFYPVGDEE